MYCTSVLYVSVHTVFLIRFSLFCRGDVVAEAGHEEELLLVDVGIQRTVLQCLCELYSNYMHWHITYSYKLT